MILKNYPSHLQISRILHKILLIPSKFKNINYYHVLRGLNGLADVEANKAVHLSRGIISVDGRETICNLP